MTAPSWLPQRVRTTRAYGKLKNAARGVAGRFRNYHLHGSDGPTDAKVEAPAPRVEQPQLETMPGCAYQKVLIPLDYPPSRDFQPRWGYARPPHAGLCELFAQRHADYLEAIRELRALQPWLSAIKPQFNSEEIPQPGWVGGPITALDSALIYYFVQKYKPRTYLEIGSGVTTCFAWRAIRDHRLETRIVSIDPEPRASIDAICDRVIRNGLETADLEIFAQLGAGDIVFLDGSHRSFMNSDVTVFMLDVLPLLKPGVIVHVHDVLLPYDYPEMFRYWYWNEQYILAVYLLAARERVRILMPSAYLSKTASINRCIQEPIVDLGSENENWRHGGSMWFTHVGGCE